MPGRECLGWVLSGGQTVAAFLHCVKPRPCVSGALPRAKRSGMRGSGLLVASIPSSDLRRMSNALLVLNAGSSSIKFAVYRLEASALAHERALHGAIRGLPDAPSLTVDGAPPGHPPPVLSPAPTVTDAHARALRALLGWLGPALGATALVAVGHRVVHGGPRFAEPVVVDAPVLDALEAFVPLAPLHQPHNLEPMRVLAEQRPDLTQVACFDTAFHRSAPAVAQAFALPPEISELGVHRYGFHGLSYEYIAGRLPEVVGALPERVIVAHLGNGASLCALDNGRSVATTMGFTALDGVPMGTRCGSLDPGVLLFLLERGMNKAQLEDLLYHRSGLLGVSGISNDVATLLASSEPSAQSALDLFCYRVGREIGSLAAALGGLDCLVFTAGIGENAAPVRERIGAEAAWLGLRFDRAANAAGGPRLSTPDSAVSAWVIPTDEERMIALHTRACLGA